MANKKTYNIFLFLSTLTRSLVEVFSVILLYDKGYSVRDIFLFLLVMYIIGIFVNYVSLRVNYKIVLVLSILFYAGSYLFLSFMENSYLYLIFFAIILSIGSYSYHAIRHFLAIRMNPYDKGNNINLFLIINYVAVMISNLLGVFLIDKLSIIGTSIVILILSFISVIPVLKLKDVKREKIDLRSVKINKSKIGFSILEQFKVIFMELQPLYIYLFIKNNMYYVGIFNVITNLASLLVMLKVSKMVKNKYFRYVNILLGVVLVMKLNIKGSLLLLGIAFLEGIFVKLYEKFSLNNLYNIDNNSVNSYLIVEELLFFTSKSIIMGIFLLLSLDISTVMYICIVGIVISGFCILDNWF